MDRGDLQVPVHGVSESDMTERLFSVFYFYPILPTPTFSRSGNSEHGLFTHFYIHYI